MADPAITHQDDDMTVWSRHRLSLLLIITVAVTLSLTIVSMFAYTSSGTAQLDLSRPGYLSVSDKVDRKDKITEYSAFGPVSKDSINEFIKLYDQQARKSKAVDAFNGDPLNPEVLEFGIPNSTE